MKITRYRCPHCKQHPEQMEIVQDSYYRPTDQEDKERPEIKLNGIDWEQYRCQCNITYSWYNLEPYQA